MTEIDDLAALLAATPTGLPYPESSDALNQGANAIKALALALDPRSPFVIEARTVVNANVAGGMYTHIFTKAFKAPPTVFVSAWSTGGGMGAYVPLPGLTNVTASQFSFFTIGVLASASPSASQPWGGGMNFQYLALGAP